MISNLFDHFTETLTVLIAKESLSIKRLFNHIMKDIEGPWRELPREFSVEMIQEHLLLAVVKGLTEGHESKEIRMNPEEAAIRLIRHGIPKENISATFKYLTVSLPNADYRLYRKTSGYPANTIRITQAECSVYISSGLTSEDTVRFVLLLDEQLPRIHEAAGTLFDEVREEFRQKQKEMIALEITKKAVEAQLSSVLPGMGINGKYKVADGKIQLHLTRTCTGEVELQLEELPVFLSDPERVESTLKVEPVSPKPDKSPDFPHSSPHKYYHSNIVINHK